MDGTRPVRPVVDTIGPFPFISDLTSPKYRSSRVERSLERVPSSVPETFRGSEGDMYTQGCRQETSVLCVRVGLSLQPEQGRMSWRGTARVDRVSTSHSSVRRNRQVSSSSCGTPAGLGTVG